LEEYVASHLQGRKISKARICHEAGSKLSFPKRLFIFNGLRALYTRRQNSSVKDAVFETLCFLEYRSMGKLQKPSNPECYTSTLEPFRVNLIELVFEIKGARGSVVG
jgi:hypothetical protein